MNIRKKTRYLVSSVLITIQLFTFLFIGTLGMAQTRKLALIVAVGNYPESSGWEKLSSVKDVDIVTEALLQQGFLEEHIIALKDRQATKAGILAAFKDLNQKATGGDIIYFHFSGHGQQITDDNGDEIFDGLDEALIPYDAGIDYTSCVAKGANHLRDDLLGELLDKLRKRVGSTGDVIAVLDACNSGTATRSIGQSRGTDRIFSIPGLVTITNPEIYTRQSFFEVTEDKSLAPLVIISGSGAKEQNREYNGYGSLSYTISHILPAMNKSNTYRELFEQVRVKMNIIVPQQNPQIEGNYNRQIFAGKAVEYQRYLTVRDWLAEKRILLDAGQLNGITTNTKVSFYPPGTTQPNTTIPIASGVVKESRFSTSIVELKENLTADKALESWVFVDEYSFDTFSVPLKVSPDLPEELKQEILKKMKGLSFIRLDNTHPQLLIETLKNDRNILRIVSNNDVTLLEISTLKNGLTQISERIFQTIQMYVQAEMLRQLESFDPNLNITFEMIPVRIDAKGNVTAKTELETKRTPAGRIKFTEGDHFKIRITNKGTRAAYYGLIDIQPDNAINVLIPETRQDGAMLRWPSDCKLEMGEEQELKAIFRITKPFGIEVFKLIVADRPLNLAPVIISRGENIDTENLNPFELLFAKSFDLISRSEKNLKLPPETIHIQTVVFEIVSKE